MAVDPTYPLLPVLGTISSALIFSLLLTSFMHESWNLGVFMQCLYIGIYNLLESVNAVLWASSTEVKAKVYCDIATHLQLLTAVGVSTSSMVVSRRLYNIAAQRTVGTVRTKLDIVVEFGLLFGIPIVVAGPLYYIVQSYRFELIEGLGCFGFSDDIGLSMMLIDGALALFPAISALFYCPKILWTFYTQRRAIHEFFQTNGSVSHDIYLRLLALGCFDIVINLPISVIKLSLDVVSSLEETGTFQFVQPWAVSHANWAKVLVITYSDFISSTPRAQIATIYLILWSPVISSFVIFSLFGFARSARSSYARTFRSAARLLGFKPKPRPPPASALREKSTSIPFGNLGLEIDGLELPSISFVNNPQPQDNSAVGGDAESQRIVERNDHA